MRVLVTGSRTWTDECVIRAHLLAFHTYVPARLVHGACPDGADAMAERVARELGWHIERHPANWSLHGKRAGFIRNAEMVHAGADVCLAFLSHCDSKTCHRRGRHPSHGTTHTADYAEAQGLRVVRVLSATLV